MRPTTEPYSVVGRIQRTALQGISKKNSVKVCYYVSRIVIAKSLKDQKQIFYEGHQSIVTSMAVHPSRTIVASSSCSQRARIDVWEVENYNRLSCIITGHQTAVNCLKFSHDGIFIGSIGVDEHFSVQVSEWETGQVVAFRNTSKRPIIDLEFNPRDKYEFSTGAYNCISTWIIKNGSIILKRVITMNTMDKNHFPYVTCLLYVNFYVGDDEGSSIVTANNFGDLGIVTQDSYHCTRKTAHKKMINSMVLSQSYEMSLITGSEDEFIKVWSMSFELLAEFNLRLSNIIEVSSTSDVTFSLP